MKQTLTVSSDILKDAVLNAAREKKAFKLAYLDFSTLQGPVSGFFFICNGNSQTQVQAITDEIKRELIEKHDIRPLHVEGYSRGEWILMDYGFALIHVFQPHVRLYYRLEDLWGDAPSQFWEE